MIKISVVTVCYNAIATLEKTIQSVIEQTYSNIEYIIIDGGSTDGTVEMIKKYENKIDFWISEPDNGIYDAMNKGKKHAQGDFLIYLGADDTFFTKQTISTIAPLLKKAEVYYGDSYMTYSRRIYWGKFNKYKLAVGNICHQAIFYPKTIYQVYDYEISFRILSDYAYNLSLFKLIPFNYLNETISIFSNNGVSSYQKDILFEAKRKKLIKDNLGIIALVICVLYEIFRKIKLYCFVKKQL